MASASVSRRLLKLVPTNLRLTAGSRQIMGSSSSRISRISGLWHSSSSSSISFSSLCSNRPHSSHDHPEIERVLERLGNFGVPRETTAKVINALVSYKEFSQQQAAAIAEAVKEIECYKKQKVRISKLMNADMIERLVAHGQFSPRLADEIIEATKEVQLLYHQIIARAPREEYIARVTERLVASGGFSMQQAVGITEVMKLVHDPEVRSTTSEPSLHLSHDHPEVERVLQRSLGHFGFPREETAQVIDALIAYGEFSPRQAAAIAEAIKEIEFYNNQKVRISNFTNTEMIERLIAYGEFSPQKAEDIIEVTKEVQLLYHQIIVRAPREDYIAQVTKRLIAPGEFSPQQAVGITEAMKLVHDPELESTTLHSSLHSSHDHPEVERVLQRLESEIWIRREETSAEIKKLVERGVPAQQASTMIEAINHVAHYYQEREKVSPEENAKIIQRLVERGDFPPQQAATITEVIKDVQDQLRLRRSNTINEVRYWMSRRYFAWGEGAEGFTEWQIHNIIVGSIVLLIYIGLLVWCQVAIAERFGYFDSLIKEYEDKDTSKIAHSKLDSIA